MENIIPIPSRRRPGRPRKASGRPKRSVQSVSRALSVLEALADRPEGLPFTDLTSALEMPTASAHRLLETLTEADYLRVDEDTGRYVIGGRMMRLAARALDHRTQLRAIARGFLEELVERTNETANLATLDAGSASFIDQVQCDRLVRAGTYLRSPLYCSAAGKSLLAFQPDAVRDELIDRLELDSLTGNTIVERAALEAELGRVRTLGYAVDDEEMEIGSRCIGAPVMLGDEPVAAISIAGPTTRISADDVRALSAVLLDVSQRLSQRVAEQFPGLRAGELVNRFVG